MNDIDLSSGIHSVTLRYDHSRAQYGHERGIPYILEIKKDGIPPYIKGVTIAKEFLDQVDKVVLSKYFIDDYDEALKEWRP